MVYYTWLSDFSYFFFSVVYSSLCQWLLGCKIGWLRKIHPHLVPKSMAVSDELTEHAGFAAVWPVVQTQKKVFPTFLPCMLRAVWGPRVACCWSQLVTLPSAVLGCWGSAEGEGLRGFRSWCDPHEQNGVCMVEAALSSAGAVLELFRGVCLSKSHNCPRWWSLPNPHWM